MGRLDTGATHATFRESIVMKSDGAVGASGVSGGCSCCSVQRSLNPPGRVW